MSGLGTAYTSPTKRERAWHGVHLAHEAGEVGAKRRERVLVAARSPLSRVATLHDLSHFVGEVYSS
jgi:hypothetical protein